MTMTTKHLLAAFFLFSAVIFSAQAQEVTEEEEEGYVYEQYFDKKSDVYTRVGLSWAGAVGWDSHSYKTKRILSYSFGIGYTHSLTYKGDVNVNAEVNLSRVGFRVTNPGGAMDLEELTMNYIQIPVIVRYYPIKEFKAAYVGAGPQIAFKSGDVQIKTQGSGQFLLMDNAVNSPDLALVGVAGVHFAKKLDLGLELRYQHSLNKFLNPFPEARHSVFQVSFFFPAEALLNIGLYFPIF